MNRRDFLQQVACAFAVASVPCTIPRSVWTKADAISWIDAAMNAALMQALTSYETFAFRPERGIGILNDT